MHESKRGYYQEAMPRGNSNLSGQVLTLVEYTEPNAQKAGKDFERKLDEGTFALQTHDSRIGLFQEPSLDYSQGI